MAWRADSARAMEAFGARLGAALEPGAVVHLRGPLGAGKTTLVRGLLRALGHPGTVKSPTYTLIESYPLDTLTVHHLDLYRLADPEELEYLGLRDLLDGQAIFLVEWPERGGGALPAADLEIALHPDGPAREIRATARSSRGHRMLGRLSG